MTKEELEAEVQRLKDLLQRWLAADEALRSCGFNPETEYELRSVKAEARKVVGAP